MSELSHIEAH
ncbi:hypothetical protein CGLO_11210 [Colletotrichum gloeosporioides Cg-14]|uniref:Uncharacterized protein n=1 Tax=Colletotrichum gloeosporioides (strain Cg-14) TaxID=1237896 RepID=T0K8U2_COLGC|nr:hypothetical protein CGLO_11210 [Colletotrichum gloeosporioides Cg-14]